MNYYNETRNSWAEGLLLRDNSVDLACVREQRSEYGYIDWTGHTVLDLGANIGAFARFAIMHGASRVTCVEPDSDNIKMLEANLMDDLMTLKKGAVNNDGQPVDLYLANNDQYDSHSIVPTRGRSPIGVDGIALRDLLGDHTAVKCDIEGGEYELDWSVLIDSAVTTVVMELHINRPAWPEKARNLMDAFADFGFTVNDPSIPADWWNIIRSWTR